MTRYATNLLDSPFGPLTLLASDAGLRAVLWAGELPGERLPWPAGADCTAEDSDHPVLRRAAEQLTAYFDGRQRSFDLPLDLDGTPFQVKAWRALAAIPFGATATYADQARRLGDPNKARAAGAANGKNPVSIVLPCHRVIGSDGSLTGFAGGLAAKRALLDFEAAVLASDRPVPFPG